MKIQPLKENIKRNFILYAGSALVALVILDSASGRKDYQEQREISRVVENTKYVLKSTSVETLLGKDFEPMRQTLKKRIREQDNAMWQSAYRNLENQRRMDEGYTNYVSSIIFTR